MSRRSFQALNGAMNTVGQNVANADTEGYTRRRVTLQADAVAPAGLYSRLPPRTPAGAGVSIHSYERMRDGLLAASVADAHTALGSAQEEQRLLGALEGLFPTGTGALGSLLGDFWNAWSDLADYPTDNGVRLALRTRAASLADTLNRVDKALALFQDGTQDALSSGVDEVNEILHEIAEINEKAGAARQGGTPDLEAEDRRDQLVKDLSAFAPVRVREDGAAGYAVTMGGMSVVQGRHVTELKLDTSGAAPRVLFGDTQVAFSAPAGNDGKLGAWLRTLAKAVPDTRGALDAMAATLVAEVNARHSAGYGLDGGTGRSFFDPTGTSAAAIRLSADVLADAGAIAASADATAPGDSTVALDIAALRTRPVLGGGTQTHDAFAADLVGGLGAGVRQASQQALGQTSVLDYLSGLERGVSGVSLDEEMTRLIQYQQAFAASARVLDTAQQMMDTLLAL